MSFGIVFIEQFPTGKAVHSSQLWTDVAYKSGSQIANQASWDRNRPSARLSLTVFDRIEATRHTLR